MTQDNEQKTPEDKILEDIYDQKHDLDEAESERSFSARGLALLKTRFRTFYILTFILYLVVIGLGIWCSINFFSAEDVKEIAFWGICLTLCGIVVIATELWFWMEMNRNGILREVKRLELQIALLRNISKGSLE